MVVKHRLSRVGDCILLCPLQSFLTKSEAAFKQHPVWASAPPAHKAQAVEVHLQALLQLRKCQGLHFACIMLLTVCIESMCALVGPCHMMLSGPRTS